MHTRLAMQHQIDIRGLRARLNWTQEQLAEYLGLDRSSVSRMEREEEPTRPSGPAKKLLEQLASQGPAEMAGAN